MQLNNQIIKVIIYTLSSMLARMATQLCLTCMGAIQAVPLEALNALWHTHGHTILRTYSFRIETHPHMQACVCTCVCNVCVCNRLEVTYSKLYLLSMHLLSTFFMDNCPNKVCVWCSVIMCGEVQFHFRLYFW